MNMKIVIAPDSFKESLSAPDVARAIARGVKNAMPNANTICLPMADGGEGTVEAVLGATNCERRTHVVQNANGQPISASWAWFADRTAVIEMATAAGLEHIPRDQRNPMNASSFGVGELILQALDAGARHLVLGLGGSATNDAGAGMMQALGLRMLDRNGNLLAPGGAALANCVRIETDGLDSRLSRVDVTIASDVNNPLCGPSGASAVFGPQKGASPAQVKQLDEALSCFANACQQALGKDMRNQPGSGAAGGLGFAAHAFMRTRFRPGVEVIAEISGLAKAIQGASLVITGEGRMDAQTLHGKTPMGVAKLAQAAGVPVIAIAGSLGQGYQALYPIGISAAFSITSGPMSLEDACQHASTLLEHRAGDIMRVWLVARHHVI